MSSFNMIKTIDELGSVKYTYSCTANSYRNSSLVIVLHDLFENVSNPLNLAILKYASKEEYIFCDVLALSLNSGVDFYQSTIKDKVITLEKIIQKYSTQYKQISIVAVGVSSIIALGVSNKVAKTILINPVFNLEVFWRNVAKTNANLGNVNVDIICKNNLTFIRKHSVIEKDLKDFSFSNVVSLIKINTSKGLLICKEVTDVLISTDTFTFEVVGDLEKFMNHAINLKLMSLIFNFINSKTEKKVDNTALKLSTSRKTARV